jgi:hypothetical protein
MHIDYDPCLFFSERILTLKYKKKSTFFECFFIHYTYYFLMFRLIPILGHFRSFEIVFFHFSINIVEFKC